MNSRYHLLLLMGLLSILWSWPTNARADDPGLGLFTGVALPRNSEVDDDWSHNYGFLVDLPLYKTFHIAPSAEIYHIGDMLVTDMDIAFKFVVPVWGFRPYAALEPGLTVYNNDQDGHLGVAAGAYINVLPGFSVILQVKYKETLSSSGLDLGVLHVNAGLLLRF